MSHVTSGRIQEQFDIEKDPGTPAQTLTKTINFLGKVATLPALRELNPLYRWHFARIGGSRKLFDLHGAFC